MVQARSVVIGALACVAATLRHFRATVCLVECEEPPSRSLKNKIPFAEAVHKAEDLCQRAKDEYGCPGLVVAVSVDGDNVFERGFGYSDVEKRVRCGKDAVMRVASISKPITMAVVAKLWEEGSLCLDKPVQDYVPKFPTKFFDNEETAITVRHLISHLSGIRHYDKKPSEAQATSKPQEDAVNKEEKEYLIKEHYESVSKSLLLFQDDDLRSKPGTQYLYSTHGWTVISAVIESIVKKPFEKYMKKVFDDLGLHHTFLDENPPLIYNRAQYYIRNEKGRLENAQYVDNSYKWAAGGFLSTAADLVHFGNAMLSSYEKDGGYLKRGTVRMMWTPVEETRGRWDMNGSYGMGWGIREPQSDSPFCNGRKFHVCHSGGAIGASSILLIMPTASSEERPVHGVVVAMIVNLQNVNLNRTALEIAELFDQACH